LDGNNLIKGRKGEPVAVSSNLGYILNGKLGSIENQTNCFTTNVLKVAVDSELN